MKVKEVGTSKYVNLDTSNFIASGGQASVYGIGSKVFKIYSSDKYIIPELKVRELSVLDKDYIIRPKTLVQDSQGKVVGYTADKLPASSFAMSQLFTSAFKTDNNLSLDKTLRLVQKLRDGYSFIHQNKILVVDGNENNFFVNNALDKVFFLDVDNYQTASFPTLAVAPYIQDYSAMTSDGKYVVSELTDWFAFAIVSFNLITNIHPYKGKYPAFEGGTVPKDRKVIERIKQHISVFNPEVTYIKSQVLDFSLIPANYKDWFYSVLEQGQRSLPPVGFGAANVPTPLKISKVVSSASLSITRLLSLKPDSFVYYSPKFLITQTEIYDSTLTKIANNNQNYVSALCSPKSYSPLLVKSSVEGCTIDDFDRKTKIDINCEQFKVIDDSLYIKRDDKLLRIMLIETAKGLNYGEKLMSNVPPLSSGFYGNVMVSRALKSNYFALIQDGLIFSRRVPEIDNYRIVNAFYQNHVLIVSGIEGNIYNKAVIVFSEDFNNYSVRIEQDVQDTGINAAVMNNGIAAHLNDGVLEVFLNKPNKTVNSYRDKLFSDYPLTLFTDGYRMLSVIDGKEFSQIKMN